jgi:hypothetical protein
VLSRTLTALSNAVSVTTQHIASTADPRHSPGWRLVRDLVHNPLWLFGWVALGGAFRELARIEQVVGGDADPGQQAHSP